jgi:hypothetical protein
MAPKQKTAIKSFPPIASPTAQRATPDNCLYAVGWDLPLEVSLTPQIGLVSQIGLFHFDDRFEGNDTGGVGYHCMVLLVANYLPELW